MYLTIFLVHWAITTFIIIIIIIIIWLMDWIVCELGSEMVRVDIQHHQQYFMMRRWIVPKPVLWRWRRVVQVLHKGERERASCYLVTIEMMN